MTNENVFAPTNGEQAPANPLDVLVGEGKKYSSPEELAKGALAAQEHIQRLEAEAAASRERDLARLEELAQYKNLRTQTPQPSPQAPQEPQKNEQRVLPTDEDLVNRVREITRQDQLEQKRASNVNEVAARLVDHYGDATKANQAMQQKALDLGVSIEFLMDSAAQSPKAFYQTVGLNDVNRQAPAPRSAVNTEALRTQNPQGTAREGTYQWYAERMKENPKLRNSAKFQMEMHNKAMEVGEDAFFGR